MNKRFAAIFFCFVSVIGCSRQPSVQTTQIDYITIDEEMSLGEMLRSAMQRRHTMIRNSRVNETVNLWADSIAAFSDWTELDYEVFILNRKDYLHFSLPGGNIYLSRTVLESVEHQHEIFAVLAHEIAHLGRRHAVDTIAQLYGYAIASQRIVGENPQIADRIVANLFHSESILNYSKQAEFNTDLDTITFMKRAGLPGNIFVHYLQRLGEQTDLQTDIHLQTHSSFPRRRRYLQNRLDISAHQPEKRLISSEFKTFQTELQEIPLY